MRNKIHAFLFLIILNNSCKTENHIDKYNVSLEALKTLPDAFYAYRHGRVYLGDSTGQRYRIWFDFDMFGNVESIFKIEDYKDRNADKLTIIKRYNIDTLQRLDNIKKFVSLSKKFKFGHIKIDKDNKISFSYKDGLAEQYVRPLNDSVQKVYINKKEFRILENGWFRHVE